MDENKDGGMWIVGFWPCGCLGAYFTDEPIGHRYGAMEIRIIIRHGGRSERMMKAELDKHIAGKTKCPHDNVAMLAEIWQMELLGGTRDPREYGWTPDSPTIKGVG